MNNQRPPRQDVVPPLAERLLSLARDALFVLDDHGCIVWCNARADPSIESPLPPAQAGESWAAWLRMAGATAGDLEALEAAITGHEALPPRSLLPLAVDASATDPAPQRLRIDLRRDIEAGAAHVLAAVSIVDVELADLRAECQRLAQLHSETSAQLQLAVDLAKIGIWRLDFKTQRIHHNQQAGEIIGLPQRPEGTPVDELRSRIHPDDTPPMIVAHSRSLEAELPSDIEARFRRTDGSWRHVLMRWIVLRDAAGAPEAALGVALDVTDRRNARSALRAADERAALAARGAGIGTWERDVRIDTAIWDEQMYRLRGLDSAHGPQTLAERQRLIHADDLPRILDAQRQAIKARIPLTYEFRVRLPDGDYRWLASRSMPVIDEQDRVVKLIGVNWDVTDAKTAEAARQDRALARRESEAKSRFLARMSHELRTPLNAVLGFTQLLQADEDGSSPARAVRLAHVRAGGEHLLALINEVLDLSSLESGDLKLELQPVSVAEIAREALPMVQALARAADVRVEIADVGGVVMADRTRLRQVLINLLSNAIKYNRPEGQVIVRAEERGTRLALQISDTGRGISPENLRHLFEPFNRLGMDTQGIEGTGIGLVIVKVLVERMGGEIAVRSEPGVGSIFELRLRTPDAATDPGTLFGRETAPAPLPRSGSAHRGTLLYVEDNPVNMLLVCELVGQLDGLEIIGAEDGESGLRCAIEQQPDLILVDMQLPDMDGEELLRRLRREPRTASIPCIALSANAMIEDVSRALAAGFSDYWTKPIDLRAFRAALDALFSNGAPRLRS